MLYTIHPPPPVTKLGKTSPGGAGGDGLYLLPNSALTALFARPAPAAATDFDVEAVLIGRADADAVEDIAIAEGAVMQGKAEVGLLESREDTVGQHGLGARHRLFGRLGDEHQGALPLVLEADQCFRRSDPARHMDVVAAAVGHKGLPAIPGGLVVAGIGQAGFFPHCASLG